MDARLLLYHLGIWIVLIIALPLADVEQRERMQLSGPSPTPRTSICLADAADWKQPGEQRTSSTLVGMGVPSKYFTLPLSSASSAAVTLKRARRLMPQATK